MKRRSRLALVSLFLGSLNFISLPTASASPVYSFTNAGATGRTGPTQAQVNSAYSGTNLAGAVTINTQGIQEWTVPATGNYRIEVYGSSRKNNGNGVASGNANGYGSYQIGTFALSSGAILKILVGQPAAGGEVQRDIAGNGGSFVATSANSPLIVAGGSGGDGPFDYSWRGFQGSTATGDGSGGAGTIFAAGGGGFTFNGDLGTGETRGGTAAQSFVNGGVGGFGYDPSYDGGFGGGGQGSSTGGGGGGYSGGSGGATGTGSPDGIGGYGPGNGGLSYNSGTNQSSGVRNSFGPGYVTITPPGPDVSSFAPTTTLTNAALTYNLVFTQSVTGLAAGDFSLSGTGSSTCTIGSPSGSGTTYTISLSGCSPGTVILTLASNAVTNSSSQTGPSSSSAAATVTIDTTAPTLSSLSAPANATYKPSDTPTFTLTFSESVTVTGSPRLTLTLDGSGSNVTKYATFQSMSDSRTATLHYTVGTDSGEYDSNGISVSSTLDLDSGAISDLAGNAISSLTISSMPSTTSILIAQVPTAPVITSITPASAQLSVAFSAASARASAITNYQYSTDNGATWKNRASGTTDSPIVITTVSASASSLVNGTTYQVRIRAVSAVGNSDSSTAVSAIPTALTISGGSNITTTYGTAASSLAFSASGGTAPYTFSLTSPPSGVSISAGVVTASALTAAGSYTITIQVTDSSNYETATTTTTITVNQATQSTLTITSTTVAYGETLTVATSGGSGSGDVSLNLISGNCTVSGITLTPTATGSCLITATKASDTNYQAATSAQVSITITTGSTTATISFSSTTFTFGITNTITITASTAGSVRFSANGKLIKYCKARATALSSPFTATCSYRPSTRRPVTITATLTPTNLNIAEKVTTSAPYQVLRRTGARG